jgi:hypothetical protein
MKTGSSFSAALVDRQQEVTHDSQNRWYHFPGCRRSDPRLGHRRCEHRQVAPAAVEVSHEASTKYMLPLRPRRAPLPRSRRACRSSVDRWRPGEFRRGPARLRRPPWRCQPGSPAALRRRCRRSRGRSCCARTSASLAASTCFLAVFSASLVRSMAARTRSTCSSTCCFFRSAEA